MEKIIDRTIHEMGKLDLFVANAVFSEREPLLSANVPLFKKTMDVNFWGTFYGLRYVAQKMVEHKTRGSIVVISSPHAVIAMPNAMAYNAAKAAIDQMARTAALELAEHKIRVNIIHPGWTDTPGERKFYTEEQLAIAGKTIPLGRMGNIHDIGRAATFLLSDDAEYMTGSTMLVDGGITLPVWAFKRV
jgi:glucose 1-dehydrogenase